MARVNKYSFLRIRISSNLHVTIFLSMLLHIQLFELSGLIITSLYLATAYKDRKTKEKKKHFS
jgi:hypothetical protein